MTDRPVVRIACDHQGTYRASRPEKFVAELQDGRRHPFSSTELETARWIEQVAQDGTMDLPAPLAGREVPFLTDGIMIVSRAARGEPALPQFLPSSSTNPVTGATYRNGRTIALDCPTCPRGPDVSERQLGRVLDVLYGLSPIDQQGRHAMRLWMVETAISRALRSGAQHR